MSSVLLMISVKQWGIGMTPFRGLEPFYVAVLSPEGQLLDVFYYRDSDEMLAKCREVEAQGYTADKGVI